MAIKTADELKAEFATGKYPTAKSFEDLIDTSASNPTVQVYDEVSNMFSAELPVGTIQIYRNGDLGSYTLTTPTGNIEVGGNSAVAFVKHSLPTDSANVWLLISTVIQSGDGAVC